MADPSAVYTLSPPSVSPITFNDGDLKTLDDLYWLTDVKGLDVADIRNPQFRRPRAHGGYKPVDWLEEPLHPVFEGVILVQSVPLGSGACRDIRNNMYADLKATLRDMYASTGTLTWTEPGVDDFTLAVSYEVRLERGWDANYSLMTFTFGLYSEASQPATVP